MLRKWSRGLNFENFIFLTSKIVRTKEEKFYTISHQNIETMYTPSFVKIPNGGVTNCYKMVALT